MNEVEIRAELIEPALQKADCVIVPDTKKYREHNIIQGKIQTNEEPKQNPKKKDKSKFQTLVKNDPSNKYMYKQFHAKQNIVFICYEGEIRGAIKQINKYDLFIQAVDF